MTKSKTERRDARERSSHRNNQDLWLRRFASPRSVSARRGTRARAPAPRRSTFTAVPLRITAVPLQLATVYRILITVRFNLPRAVRGHERRGQDTPRGWRCPACCEVQARVSTGRTDFVRRTYSGIPTSLQQIGLPHRFFYGVAFTPRFTWILGEISSSSPPDSIARTSHRAARAQPPPAARGGRLIPRN